MLLDPIDDFIDLAIDIEDMGLRLCHERVSGRAIITLRNHLGARQDVLLPGAYDSPESRKEYERYLALILANRGRLPAPAGAA